MSVGIYEAGQNYLSLTIDLNHFAAIVFQPWILQSLGSAADGNDFAAYT